MDKLFDRLQMLEDRYEELGELLSDPDVIADTQRFTKLSKEMADLRETVEKYNQYKKVTQQIKDDEEMLNAGLDDEEMASMVKDELTDSKAEKEKLEEEIKILLITFCDCLFPRSSYWFINHIITIFSILIRCLRAFRSLRKVSMVTPPGRYFSRRR